MAYHLDTQGRIVFHRGRPTLELPKKESDEDDLNENGPALSMKDSSIDADDDADLNKNGSEEHRELEREKTYEEEDESEKRDRTIF